MHQHSTYAAKELESSMPLRRKLLDVELMHYEAYGLEDRR